MPFACTVGNLTLVFDRTVGNLTIFFSKSEIPGVRLGGDMIAVGIDSYITLQEIGKKQDYCVSMSSLNM